MSPILSERPRRREHPLIVSRPAQSKDRSVVRIITAAVRATSDHVLAHFDVIRLEAPVFEWNPASMRVLEKCGFVREGVLRRSVLKDGQVIDAVLYARLR